MFSKKQIAQYSSLDIEDGNQELKEFYEKHFEFFRKCCATDFEKYVTVLRDLAVILHDTLYYDDQWKAYALEMGIPNNRDIAIISQSAKTHNDLPLYITMAFAIQRLNGKLDRIIKALLNIPRYDALEYLRPHVQKLLDKMKASGEKELVSNRRMPCLESESADSSLHPSRKLAKHFTLAVKSEFSANHPKCQIESLQRNIRSENFIMESKSLPCLISSEQNTEELVSPQEVSFFPSAPSEEYLTVFIQHTEQDIEVARELSTRMEKLGIVCKTFDDVELLLQMDCTSGLSRIVQEMDFIVPVVSNEFFRQIHPHMCEKYMESSDALNNRTLYQLINTQYQSNRCVNFKVRPVLMPGMNRGLLTSDVVLFYGFKLWQEFPKLVRILKETKRLLPHYPFN